jgi:hypothetical protein
MSSFGPQEEAAVDLLANEPERAGCLEAEPVEEARHLRFCASNRDLTFRHY